MRRLYVYDAILLYCIDICRGKFRERSNQYEFRYRKCCEICGVELKHILKKIRHSINVECQFAHLVLQTLTCNRNPVFMKSIMYVDNLSNGIKINGSVDSWLWIKNETYKKKTVFVMRVTFLCSNNYSHDDEAYSTYLYLNIINT